MSNDLEQKDGRVQRVQSSDEAVVFETQAVSDAAFDSLKAKGEHFEEKLTGACVMATFYNSDGMQALDKGVEAAFDNSAKPSSPKLG